MRVISMVPSWTETLITAGATVIGRTRFCVHPQPAVKTLPVVGGTKDIRWPKVNALKPDYLIFDKEENTVEMAASCPFPYYASHVTDLFQVSSALNDLAEILSNNQLADYAERWQRVAQRTSKRYQGGDFPGLLKWIRKPEGEITKVVYLIWHNPWMCISPETFIAQVLAKIGFEDLLWSPFSDSAASVSSAGAAPSLLAYESKNPSPLTRYPTLNPQELGPGTLFLCSTEPFPFAKKTEVMASLPGAVALVDGQAMSWFGVRALRFLESA